VEVLILGLLLGLARQLGVVLIRLGADRPLLSGIGLDIGTPIDPFTLTDLTGTKYGIHSSKSGRNLLIFLSESCPVCQSLLPSLAPLASQYADADVHVNVVLKTAPSDRGARWILELQQAGATIAVAPEVYDQFRVTITPFAVAVSPECILESRGTPNSLAQLENLLGLETYGFRGPALKSLQSAELNGNQEFEITSRGV
jgi:methylamine dehydrogenase accessory protein MauD